MKGINTVFLSAGLCLSSLAFAGSRTTLYSYTAEGLVESADGQRSDVADVTRYAYDVHGNRMTMTNALGHVTHYTAYDGAGRLLRTVDPNGLVTSFSYHPRGWLLSRTVGEGVGAAVTHYDYDAAGNMVRVTHPAGDYLEFTYDAANRLTEVMDLVGNRLIYTLDASGNRVGERLEDPTGAVARYLSWIYDDLNRVQQQIGADPTRLIAYAYDPDGNLIEVGDALGRTRVSGYDALDRLISQLDPALGQTGFAFDPRDNLVRLTDPRGNSTDYAYNAFDEKIAQQSPDTGTSTYTYDDAGNLLSITDARGVTVTYAYDALDRLTDVAYPDASIDVSYTYDLGPYGIGRLTGMQDAEGVTTYAYDQRGNLVNETRVEDDGIESIVLYRYDASDRLVGMTYPSGREIDFDYDQAGNIRRISSQFDGQSDVLAEDIEYLPFGPASGWLGGNGLRTERLFDQDYRLTRVTVDPLMDLSYGHDPVGNIVSIDDGRDVLRNQVLAYDSLDRLIAADGGYGMLAFEYDAVGNRLMSNEDGAATALDYEPASNRLTANLTSGEQYEYDAAGNRTAMILPDGTGWRYLYGDDNRLHQVIRAELQTYGKGKNRTTELVEVPVATFGYNGQGQRVRKTNSAGAIYFRYGRKGELLAEIDDTGKVIREYIYLNGLPLAIATYQSGSDSGTTEIIIDNDTPHTSSTGDWGLQSDRKAQYFGEDYRLAQGGTGSSYRWTPGVPEGAHEVQVRWVASRKNTSQAMFVIQHAGISDTLSVDQTKTGGQWVSLGTYMFDGHADEYIEVSDANGQTVADAVRLIAQAPPIGSLQSAGIQYLHVDHLGTPQVLTDAAGDVLWRADYRPFGYAAIAGDEALQNLRFPGQYHDAETGLYYNYFRDYDPAVGRYIQSDPVGLDGGLNTYAYVNSNPFVNTDPYGLFEWHGNWCGPDWTGGYEKSWDALTPAEWRKVKGPVDALDSCCVVHDKQYADCRTRNPCDADARAECFKHADRGLYRCSKQNPISGGFSESGLREWMRRSRPSGGTNNACCEN